MKGNHCFNAWNVWDED